MNEGRRRRDPKTLIRRYVMGYNAKLAVQPCTVTHYANKTYFRLQ